MRRGVHRTGGGRLSGASVSRTLPQAAGPRMRWWRVAHAALQALVARPVDVVPAGPFRYIDVLGVYSLRVDESGERVRAYRIDVQCGRAERLEADGRWLSLDGLDSDGVQLRAIIQRDAACWAEASDAQALDASTLDQLGARLHRALLGRWTADGTVARVRHQVTQVLALQPEQMRLARLITPRRCDQDTVTVADYEAAWMHRDALLALEREAAWLMPVYAALVAPYTTCREPMHTLRQAFVDRISNPWQRSELRRPNAPRSSTLLQWNVL